MNTTTSQDIVSAVRSGELDKVIALLEAGIGRQKPADLSLGLAIACFLGYRKIARELVRFGAPLNLPAGLADASPLAMSIKGGQKKTSLLLISLGAQIPPGMNTKLTEEELAEAQSIARRRATAGKAKRSTAGTPGTHARHTSGSATPPPPPPARPHPLAAHPPISAPRPITPPVASSKPAAPPAVPPPRPAARTLAPLDFTLPTATPSAPPAATAAKPAPAPSLPLAAAKRSRGGVVEEIEMTGCYGVDTNVLEGDLMRWNTDDRSNKDDTLNMPELKIKKPR